MNKITKILLFVFVAGCILIPNLKTSHELSVAEATDAQSKNTIHVTGEGSMKSVPDIAYINVGVTTSAKDAKTAQNDNDKKISAVSTALKELGIKPENIQTQNFNIYPMYDYLKEGGRKLRGYEVNHQLKVLVTEIDKVGTILDKAITAGANNNVNISFSLSESKQSQLYNMALKEAIKQAEAKAKTLAQSIEVSINKPQQIIEGSTAYPPVIYPAKELMNEKAMADSVPIEAGELTIRATVTAIYNY